MRAISVIFLFFAMLGTALAERPSPQQARRPPPPSGPTRHDTAFKSVPDSKLQIRAVEYHGSTNGKLTVQVKNTAKTAQKFVATGLYFVPEGDPDKAPQRLGAVGPMQIATGKEAREAKELEVAAGATVEVQLDVFCIDSHRPSPSPQNRFNVGATKLPKELATQIEKRADYAVSMEAESGAAAPRPAATPAIQSEVWKSRDAKWVELDGEGKQEAGKKK